MSELTFKKRDIFVAVAIALLGMALYVVAMPNPIKTAHAAGGDNPTSAPANACVAPALGSASSGDSTTGDTSTTNTTTTTKEVEETTTSHDNHDVVTVHDVTVGDILSDNEVTVGDINVLNDLVDVTNNTVKVDGVLNPVTSLLSHVSL